MRHLGRLDPKTCLFMMCDVQEAFRSAIHKMPAVIATAERMITTARTLNVPMCVTEQYPKGLKNTVSELDISGFAKVRRAGPPAVCDATARADEECTSKICTDFRMTKTNYIRTEAREPWASGGCARPRATTPPHPRAPSAPSSSLPPLLLQFEKTCFTMLSPEVRTWLRTDELKERKSVVLFGIEAHVCVQQTTLDLLEEGYDVHLLLDGVSSQTVTDRGVALSRLQSAGAFCTTSESVLMELIRGKEHESFKPISALLRTRPDDPLEGF